MDRLDEIKKVFEEDNSPIHRISRDDMEYLLANVNRIAELDKERENFYEVINELLNDLAYEGLYVKEIMLSLKERYPNMFTKVRYPHLF